MGGCLGAAFIPSIGAETYRPLPVAMRTCIHVGQSPERAYQRHTSATIELLTVTHPGNGAEKCVKSRSLGI